MKKKMGLAKCLTLLVMTGAAMLFSMKVQAEVTYVPTSYKAYDVNSKNKWNKTPYEEYSLTLTKFGEPKKKVIITRMDGDEGVVEEKETITYTYNKKQQLTREKHVIGETVINIEYKYNKKGQLSKVISDDIDSVEVYRYNSKGQLTRRTMTFPYGDDVAVIAYIYTYTKTGLLSKLTMKETSDGTTMIHYTMKYTYDKKKRLRKQVEERDFYRNTTYYNTLGLITKEVTADLMDGEVVDERTSIHTHTLYKKKYDKMDVVTDPDGKKLRKEIYSGFVKVTR